VSRRALLLAGGALAAVLLVMAVVVAARAAISYGQWQATRPPPAAPGVVRLDWPDRHLPPPRQGVRLSDGSTVYLAMGGIDGQGGHRVGHVVVTPAQGSTEQLDLDEGASGTVGGVTVQVVHLWSMPDPHNDAVDVEVAGR
jgi:hypothetical protein